MKLKEALNIVLKAAYAQANGHQFCAEIHEAIGVVREKMKKKAAKELEQKDLL